MPIVPAPLLCLFSPTALDAPLRAAWRERADSLLDVNEALSAGQQISSDPIDALRDAAHRHPNRDVLLADARGQVSTAGLRVFLGAACANPAIDVLSAMGSARPELDPLPETTDLQSADPGLVDALFAACGENALFESATWSSGLSFWRASALRAIPGSSDAALEVSVRGAVHGRVFVASPELTNVVGERMPFVQTIHDRLLSRIYPVGWSARGRPVLLHVLHGWGGGAERFVREMMRNDGERAQLVLMARGDPMARIHGQLLALHDDLDAPPLREWSLTTPIADCEQHSAEYVEILRSILDDWGVGAVLVSSLIGHSLDVLRSGLPTAVCCHDYFPLWPILHADFGDAKRPFDDAAMGAALEHDAAGSPFTRHPAADWIALRTAYVRTLIDTHATMVAPSSGVRENQLRMAPDLSALEWHTIGHGFDGWHELPVGDAPLALESTIANSIAVSPASSRLRVLVLGSIHGGKGEVLLRAALPLLSDAIASGAIEFVLLGSSEAGMHFFGMDGVHVLRNYRHADLPRMVATLKPDLALMPVSVAETWSYTLGELWSLDVPVLATRLGSLGERIEHGVSGLLADANATAIAGALRQLVSDRASLHRLRAPSLPGLEAMIHEWHAALPVQSRNPMPALPASKRRLQHLAAERQRRHSQQQASALQQRFTEQADELERRTQWAIDLESSLQQARSAFSDVQQANTQHLITVDTQQQEMDRQNHQLVQLRTQVERNATELVAAQEHSRAIERQLQTMIAELDTSLSMRRELETELHALQASHQPLLAVLARSEADLMKATADTQQLSDALHSQHALYAEDTADLARQRDIAIGQRDTLDAERTALLRSRSWRYTGPLRRLRLSFMRAPLRLRFTWLRLRANLARTLASIRRRGMRGTVQRARDELRHASATSAGTPRLVEPATIAITAVPTSTSPRASIVIPVFNQLIHTLNCLQAIADCGDATAFEVIVVDDGSSDATASQLPKIKGLRYQRNATNLGFIGACNAGAIAARGEFIVFLNNDTAVQPGWLDALLGTFDAHADVGLVGAKLVYPDGRLQEAGGIVFADGSGWNYGRFEDPADPRFNHVRDVDYCSGAAIALRTKLFRTLGGFDACYAPAYYEDTDLAMQVRDAGLRVLYQPESVVVHYEGATAGTDIASGIKAYQAINQRTFVERWRTQLSASHPAAGSSIEHAARHFDQRRMLVIDACTPMPDRDSGSLRLFNLLALLRESHCAVDFFADNLKHDGDYTRALQRLGVRVWWSPWLRDVPRWFADYGPQFDVILASRHYVAGNYLMLARQLAPKARFVFDTVDLHFLREQREADLANDPALQRSAQQTRARELRIIRESDLTLVVSPIEQSLLALELPQARVEVVSNVHRATATQPGFSNRRDLLFVGGFRHPPNADAATWIAREIHPLIRARRADIVLHLVGSDVTPEIMALGLLDGVVVHGHVPDLTPLMEGCRIGVAPLRYGAGVKGKINLSMVHGQPVVATSAAVEGMYLQDGIDVLVADDPQAFADAVLRLYEDEVLWSLLAQNGLANVQQHFSFDAARAALQRVLG